MVRLLVQRGAQVQAAARKRRAPAARGAVHTRAADAVSGGSNDGATHQRFLVAGELHSYDVEVLIREALDREEAIVAIRDKLLHVCGQ